MGPFGEIGSISDEFVKQLAAKEGLVIDRNSTSAGLIPSIDKLNLSEEALAHLSKEIIDFYENTDRYILNFSVKWSPIFKPLGKLLNRLFSHRIEQLYVPANQSEYSESLGSEIINLLDSKSKAVKYTIWYRGIESTGRAMYSGIYTTCTLPSGDTCIKAIFPLPKGNATVIMLPRVGKNGELFLTSSGSRFGDPGFYFLLTDSKGDFWSKFVVSIRNQLNVHPDEESVFAEHTLTLWHRRVLQFNYRIHNKDLELARH